MEKFNDWDECSGHSVPRKDGRIDRWKTRRLPQEVAILLPVSTALMNAGRARSAHFAGGLDMSTIVRWIDQNLYRDYCDHWDDELFRSSILKSAEPDWEVLDLGAGAGVVRQMNFRGQVQRVCGLDPDGRVLNNVALDEAKVGVGEAIPFGTEAFDLVFADNVLEHLEDPAAVFREVWRTLKPGGTFLFKTPNRWHYVPTLARLMPHRSHQLVNRLRGRREVDTFPTLYRANTPAAIRRLADQTQFEVEEIRLVEGRPEYLRILAPTYLAGLAYERLVNAVPALERFRIVMLGRLRKPEKAVQILPMRWSLEGRAAA
jgi:SAM-dependent methyltransferase